MKKFIRSCWFNMDTACVEVTLTDGSVVGIDCIAVEDSPNGIKSAYAAGCKPVMVPDLTQPDDEIKPLLYGVADTLADINRFI